MKCSRQSSELRFIGMSNSFSITEEKDGIVLKREGEDKHRIFKSEPEAIEAARQSLDGPEGEVSIFDAATGLSREVKIEADAPPHEISA